MASTPTLQSVSGINLGIGEAVFAGSGGGQNPVLGFKTLIAGDGLVIKSDSGSITLTSTSSVIETTGVSPGTYSNASFTVDQYGRILAATDSQYGGASAVSSGTGLPVYIGTIDGTLQFASLAGSDTIEIHNDGSTLTISAQPSGVQSVTITGTADISAYGNPITTTGTYGLALLPTGVTAGTYTMPTMVVDQNGRVLDIVSAQLSNVVGTVATATGGIGTSLIESVSASTDGPQSVYLKGLFATGGISVQDDGSTITLSYSAPPAVSSVSATGSNGITVSGGPITTSGTFQVSLSNTGVTAGTYSYATFSVDAAGRILGASSGSAVPVSAVSLGIGAAIYAGVSDTSLQFMSLAASGSISLSSDGQTITITGAPGVTHVAASGDGNIIVAGSPISTSGTLALSLGETGVTPGTYPFSTVVVDKFGRIEAAQPGNLSALTGSVTSSTAGVGVSLIASTTVDATSGANDVALMTLQGAGGIAISKSGSTVTISSTASLGVTSVTANGTSGVSVAGGPITSTGTFTVGLAPSGVAAGTYSNPTVVVDATGRILYAAQPASAVGTVSSVMVAATAPLTVTETDAINSTGTFTVGMAASGVSPGTYMAASVVVDSFGRITSAESTPVVTSVGAVGSNGILVSGSPITTTGNLAFSLAESGVATGTYSFASLSVDQFGRILDATDNSANVVTSVSIDSGDGIAVSGDTITTTGTYTVALSASGVTPGTYVAPTIAVDAYGRILDVSETPASSIEAIGPSGLTQALTLPSEAAAGVASVTLSGDCVLTISGGVVGSFQSLTVMIYGDASTTYSWSVGQPVMWQNSAAPVMTVAPGSVTILTLQSPDAATTLFGSATSYGLPAA